MLKLQFLKMLIFPRALQNLLNWVSFSFFFFEILLCLHYWENDVYY